MIEGAWLMPTVASTLCSPPCEKRGIRYSHLHMVGHCCLHNANKKKKKDVIETCHFITWNTC
jgi:hypothetical protein